MGLRKKFTFKYKQKKYIYKRPNLIKGKDTLSFLRFKMDPFVKKLVNILMRHGKKSKAEKIANDTFDFLNGIYPGRALHLFYQSLFKARRDIGIRKKPKPKKRRKRQSFDVYIPYRITSKCGLFLGLRAILESTKRRSSSLPFYENLSNELLEVSSGRGEVIAKRYSLNSLAKRNRRRAVGKFWDHPSTETLEENTFYSLYKQKKIKLK